MQAFGHFSSNKMEFYGLNGIMGHLCLHKNARLCLYVPQNANVLSKGSPFMGEEVEVLLKYQNKKKAPNDAFFSQNHFITKWLTGAIRDRTLCESKATRMYLLISQQYLVHRTARRSSR